MFSYTNYAQELNSKDIAYQKYTSEQETLNQSFAKYFYRNYEQIYSLEESKFVTLLDSLSKNYTDLLINIGYC